MTVSNATAAETFRGTRPDIKADDPGIGKLDYATLERRVDELMDQLHCVRGIIGTVSDSVECMIAGRRTGQPHDPIFALHAARDLLNKMEEGLDVNALLAPTDGGPQS